MFISIRGRSSLGVGGSLATRTEIIAQLKRLASGFHRFVQGRFDCSLADEHRDLVKQGFNPPISLMGS